MSQERIVVWGYINMDKYILRFLHSLGQKLRHISDVIKEKMDFIEIHGGYSYDKRSDKKR